MLKIILPGTDLAVSRFSFGTAALFNVGTAKQRANLLASAYDNGFTHFDTAPYYGFGMAERDLAPLLKAHPDITVTTKVGIYSPGGENQSAPQIFLRKAAGRLIKAISRPTIDWSLERAREALSASLARLQRDRVELYLLHEADADLIATDEWLKWLEAERASGRVGQFGIAVDAAHLTPFVTHPHPLTPVIQTLDSLDAREADRVTNAGRPFQITFGYVTAARSRPDSASLSVRDVLAAALRRNTTGSVIVSTRKIERLPQFAEIVSAVNSEIVSK